MTNAAELEKMRRIASCAPRIIDNHFAHELRQAMIDGHLKFHEGSRRFQSSWGNPCNEPLTVEQFLPPSIENQRDILMTYRNCIDCELVNGEDDQALIRIQVYSGDNLYGHRQGMRCEVYLSGPWWDIKRFREAVESRYQRYCIKLAQREEDRKRSERGAEIGKLLLSGDYQINEEEDDDE